MQKTDVLAQIHKKCYVGKNRENVHCPAFVLWNKRKDSKNVTPYPL